MRIIAGYAFLPQVKGLIQEYLDFLGRDLSFQHLDAELDHLDVKFAPPNGRLLVAQDDDGHIAGCVAYYQHSPARCEMKRLYVQPAYRKQHIGAQLVEEIVRLAQADGYTEMVLDTITPLQSAIRLYTACGFTQTTPYYDNPMDDVLYLHRML